MPHPSPYDFLSARNILGGRGPLAPWGAESPPLRRAKDKPVRAKPVPRASTLPTDPRTDHRTTTPNLRLKPHQPLRVPPSPLCGGGSGWGGCLGKFAVSTSLAPPPSPSPTRGEGSSLPEAGVLRNRSAQGAFDRRHGHRSQPGPWHRRPKGNRVMIDTGTDNRSHTHTLLLKPTSRPECLPPPSVGEGRGGGAALAHSLSHARCLPPAGVGQPASSRRGFIAEVAT